MKVGESRFHIVLLEDLGMREIGGKKYRYGLFQCHCGNIKEMKISSVKNYQINSCGCLNKKITYGNKSHSRIYRIWYNIIDRCENKMNKSYKDYGGRGITICKNWKNDFRQFEKWSIDNGYNKYLQIDRIDNDSNYEPSNCQWVTSEENCAIGKRRIFSNNTTGYTGVSIRNSKFIAYIDINKKRISLGVFNTVEEAVESRINAEIEYLGKQKTNFHYLKESN